MKCYKERAEIEMIELFELSEEELIEICGGENTDANKDLANGASYWCPLFRAWIP